VIPGLVVHPWTGVSDGVRLGAVSRWVTPELVGRALARCGRRDSRPGALPAGFMVYFTLALALFQQDSYDDVAEHMVSGIAGMSAHIPNRASFTRARQRLGPQPLEAVFRALARPLAPDSLDGAFYQGMRIAAVDGLVLDAPDTEANRSELGGPSDSRGNPAGYPQLRLVTLTEAGTHAQLDAAVGRFRDGEQELAITMAGSAA
jgi:Insertion element 4 transposase N-terminal